ncbi:MULTISPECIES: hypothetical protein [unclassified Microbacterium]|nr:MULTISPECIES: hypothetical protein [unclassified Microbacterium]MBN9223586.1 hypothetical protein [Microbacterium sp.]
MSVSVGELLELLVGALSPEQWRVPHGLGIVYRVAASRRPVGEALRGALA